MIGTLKELTCSRLCVSWIGLCGFR